MFSAKTDKNKIDKSRKLHRPEEFQISTVIAEGLSIEGDLIGKDGLRIDGQIKGNIRMDEGVIIGESARVEGDISCKTLIIYGHVVGHIYCETLILKSASKLYGNVSIERFTVDMGGQLVGSVEIIQSKEPIMLENKAG